MVDAERARLFVDPAVTSVEDAPVEEAPADVVLPGAAGDGALDDAPHDATEDAPVEH